MDLALACNMGKFSLTGIVWDLACEFPPFALMVVFAAGFILKALLSLIDGATGR